MDSPIPEQDENEVAEIIRRRIVAEGPIPFATFMAIALTHPEAGYYVGPEPRPVREGDFLTAPELHPIFGQCIAEQIEEIWARLGKPKVFTIREDGAGAGTLAVAILAELARRSSGLLECVRYVPVEINAHRRAELRSRLEGAGFGGLLAAPEERIGNGVDIANEYVDALPVHRLVFRNGVPRERYVDWDGERFVEIEGPLSSPQLRTALIASGVSTDGVVVEVRPAAKTWLAEVASSLDHGVILVIDYGGAASELYGPHRPEGTLVAYRRHRVVPDVLAAPGRQDLTAHVDFSDLERTSEQLGLLVLGRTNLAAFLIGTGLEERLRRAQEEQASSLEDLLLLRSAVRRLLDPRALGHFQVLALGRGVGTAPPLRGLAARLPRRVGESITLARPLGRVPRRQAPGPPGPRRGGQRPRRS